MSEQITDLAGDQITEAPMADAATEDSLGPLTLEQEQAVMRVSRQLPDAQPIQAAEVGALGMEALEGYVYGERIRYDSQGRKWSFLRVPINDQWFLQIEVEFYGVPLIEGAVRLDRVASKEGEAELLALVDWMAGAAAVRQAQVIAAQKAFQAEADAAVAGLMEQPPIATLIARPVASSTDDTDPLDSYPMAGSAPAPKA